MITSSAAIRAKPRTSTSAIAEHARSPACAYGRMFAITETRRFSASWGELQILA